MHSRRLGRLACTLFDLCLSWPFHPPPVCACRPASCRCPAQLSRQQTLHQLRVKGAQGGVRARTLGQRSGRQLVGGDLGGKGGACEGRVREQTQQSVAVGLLGPAEHDVMGSVGLVRCWELGAAMLLVDAGDWQDLATDRNVPALRTMHVTKQNFLTNTTRNSAERKTNWHFEGNTQVAHKAYACIQR
jgi:hypothetical protein